MEIHENEIAELRLWAKDDIVPKDLQDLCKVAANSIVKLQAETKRLKEELRIARGELKTGHAGTLEAVWNPASPKR